MSEPAGGLAALRPGGGAGGDAPQRKGGRLDSPAQTEMSSLPISIAIPTLGREEVLVSTIEALLALTPRAAEVLVLDQTPAHAEATAAALEAWDRQGRIRWIRLAEPSIPAAMNRGLVEASQDIVLFLDDDVVPFPELVAAHSGAHRQGAALVAGRVIQPWDGEVAEAPWARMRFASTERCDVEEFMGGNFSVRRRDAAALGGFDENFVRVAYNFEREFADRWRAQGGTIRFCPGAAIRHLKAPAGGTRTFGDHRTTWLPGHAVGAYYYLLRSRSAKRRVREFLARPIRAVATRHHLRRPWWIPVTLVAELLGMGWALALSLRGPRYGATLSRERT